MHFKVLPDSNNKKTVFAKLIIYFCVTQFKLHSRLFKQHLKKPLKTISFLMALNIKLFCKQVISKQKSTNSVLAYPSVKSSKKYIVLIIEFVWVLK